MKLSKRRQLPVERGEITLPLGLKCSNYFRFEIFGLRWSVGDSRSVNRPACFEQGCAAVHFWPRAAVDDGPFPSGAGVGTLAAQKWGNGRHSQRGPAVGTKEGEQVEKQPTFPG